MNDEVVVKVDGLKHTFPSEKYFVCEDCEKGWSEFPDENKELCPHCEEYTPVQVTTELSLYPKYLWNGAESVDEMISRTEHKARVLEELQDKGWKLKNRVGDGWAHLTKSTVATNSGVSDDE